MSICPPLEGGLPYVKWIASVFGDCVYDPLELVGFWLGLSSIGFWLCAQFPQIVENYRNHNADALSPTFLVIWLFGDVTNLVGCLYGRQLPTQTATAIYFVTIDFFLWSQWAYYLMKNHILPRRRAKLAQIGDGKVVARKRKVSTFGGGDTDEYQDSHYEYSVNGGKDKNSRDETRNYDYNVRGSASATRALPHTHKDTDELGIRSVVSIGSAATISPSPAGAILDQTPPSDSNSTSTSGSGQFINGNRLQSVLLFAGFVVSFVTFGVSLSLNGSIYASGRGHGGAGAGNRLLFGVEMDTAKGKALTSSESLVGMILGWISAILYVASRLPQIIKNQRRKSTEGLSLQLFFCAVMGNLTYAASIFIRSMGVWSFIWNKFPWLVGSIGTLCFDFTIFVQFWVFKGRTAYQSLNV